MWWEPKQQHCKDKAMPNLWSAGGTPGIPDIQLDCLPFSLLLFTPVLLWHFLVVPLFLASRMGMFTLWHYMLCALCLTLSKAAKDMRQDRPRENQILPFCERNLAVKWLLTETVAVWAQGLHRSGPCRVPGLRRKINIHLQFQCISN